MMVRRTQAFPGRKVIVNEIEPEVGQAIDVTDEIGAMLIARGDFQDAELPWPPVTEPKKAKVTRGPPEKGKKAKAEPVKASPKTEGEEG